MTFQQDCVVGIQLQFEFMDSGASSPLPCKRGGDVKERLPTLAAQQRLEVQRLPAVAPERAALPTDTADDSLAGDAGQCSAVEFAQKQADVDYLADHAVEFLDWLLQRNLKFLTSRGDPITKRSVVEWVFAPDVLAIARADGDVIPLALERVPFSFQWVCSAVGLSADDVRNGVSRHLKPAQACVSEVYDLAMSCQRARENTP